jgi:hypothetical protein
VLTLCRLSARLAEHHANDVTADQYKAAADLAAQFVTGVLGDSGGEFYEFINLGPPASPVAVPTAAGTTTTAVTTASASAAPSPSACTVEYPAGDQGRPWLYAGMYLEGVAVLVDVTQNMTWRNT